MASRQLVCLACVRNLQRISKMPDVLKAGETIRFVLGKSRHSYRCDDCNAELGRGMSCVAVTMLARGERLGRWESDYIVLDEAVA